MKELSIEEKAKAYDEAIKRGLDYIRHTPATKMVTRQDIFEAIFPELKESEDEKIRKALIEHFRWNAQQILNDFDNKEVRAWLENQGEQKPTNNSLPKYNKGDILTDGKSTYKVLSWDYTEKGIAVYYIEGNGCKFSWICNEADEKLKPVEQKPNCCISSTTKQKLEDNLNKALEKETPESCNEFLDEQGEQKSYGQRQECVDCQFNYAGECKGSCAMKRDEQKPAIEMKSAEESLGIDSETYNKIVDECVYGEQNPSAWSEEDENRINRLIAYFEDKESFTAEDDIVYANWLKSIKNRVQLQPRQEWSEEDEGYYDAIIAKLEVTQEDALLTDYEMDFLKSLKERVLPESTWTEEDDNCLSTIIAEFSKCAGKSVSKDEWMRCNDFLNSLKDRVQQQNTWKPSEEQMEALRQAAYEPEKNWSEKLQSLYCDLKKL